MKTSGIARKIDRLGRIVIPKEIRSALRISSGDYVDMHAEGAAIIIQKTEVLGRYSDIAESYARTISLKTGAACFICSRDSVIAGSGAAIAVGQPIGDQLRLRLLKNKFIYTQSAPFTDMDGSEKQLSMQCIAPLNCDGEIFGAIVLYSVTEHALNDEQLIFIKGATELLCGQLQLQ